MIFSSSITEIWLRSGKNEKGLLQRVELYLYCVQSVLFIQFMCNCTYIIMDSQNHSCHQINQVEHTNKNQQASTLTNQSTLSSKRLQLEITTIELTPQTEQDNSITTQQLNQQSATSWSDYQLMYLINYILTQVQTNEAFGCNYAHLFIGLAYLQAHQLSVNTKTITKQSYAFDLFRATIKKINAIKYIHPPQMEESVLQEIVTDCLNYYRRSDDKEYFMRKLRKFLQEHRPIMDSFMPMYFEYFIAAANYTLVFKQPPNLADIQKYLDQRKAEVAKRYSHTAII